MKALINSFTAGEVTPLVHGRVDMDSMRRACRDLKNFVPRVFGGVFRRPSMMHVSDAVTPSHRARLIPFSFSTDRKFVIELGDLQLRIFNADTGAVVFGPIDSPWNADQLDAVFFTQVNNVMWLTHRDIEPYELIRVSDSSWTLGPIPWTAQNAFPPMRDDNVDATKLSLSAVSGNGVLMSADADLFQPGHVGSWWKVGHFRGVLSSELTFDPDPLRSSETADVTLSAQTWKINTSGRWSGTIYVEKYNADDLAYDVEEQRENSTGNQVSLTGFGTGRFRLRVRDVTVSPGDPVVFTIGIWNGSAIVSAQTITFSPPGYLNEPSDEIRIRGRWELATYGRWAGEIYLEEKNSSGSWDVIRRWTGEMDRNIAASGSVDGESTLRLRGANVYAAPASDVARPRWSLEATDSLVYGLVRVESYIGPRQVTVDVHSSVSSTTATTHWAEGAFSLERGFPACAALHEQRLIFAGTRSQPQDIWGSVTADFRNFERTGLDDGSFAYQLGAQESNPIVWLASQDGLIVGTEGDEWLLTGGGDNPITPSNVRTKRQSGYGSFRIQPLLVGSTVLFAQRGGLSVLEYVFQWETQNYIAPNVTQLFSHRVLSGVRSMAYSQTPERLLWIVTNDGRLASCTYRREEQVVAWAIHETAGEVESVASVYGVPAGGDEVWLVVKRNGARRIERLKSSYWSALESGGQVWHLDAAKEKAGSFSALDGLGHLEGETVGIVADGAELPDAKVNDGSVAVPVGTIHAVAGLKFESLLRPMPIEIQGPDGTAQGRKFKVSGLATQLYRTQAGQYGDSQKGPFYDLVLRQSTDAADAPVEAFTGLKKLQTMAQHRDSVETTIKTNSAMPLNILAVIPTLDVYGG